MRSIVIMILGILTICNTIYSQNEDEKNRSIDNDSIYISLLERHINYLQSTSNIVNRLYDSELLLIVPYPISEVFPDFLTNRKVIVVNDLMLDSLARLRIYNFIEIRPMYIENKKLIFVFGDISTIPVDNSYVIQVHGGSKFIYSFDCSIQDYILRETRH